MQRALRFEYSHPRLCRAVGGYSTWARDATSEMKWPFISLVVVHLLWPGSHTLSHRLAPTH